MPHGRQLSASSPCDDGLRMLYLSASALVGGQHGRPAAGRRQRVGQPVLQQVRDGRLGRVHQPQGRDVGAQVAELLQVNTVYVLPGTTGKTQLETGRLLLLLQRNF